MRTIKFKALELDTGKWVYGSYIEESGYYMNNNIPDLNQPVTRHYILSDGIKHEILRKTLCQFTGLYDRNKVEIYEHDNVKHRN